MIPSIKKILEARANAIEKGDLEFTEIDLQTALDYCKSINFDIYKHIYDFDERFLETQKRLKYGKTVRKDMPRITKADIEIFSKKLINGELDIEKPFASSTNPKNQFPTHLKGDAAEEFLIRGLKDGNLSDDKVKVNNEIVPVGKLFPTQEQIYFDQVISFLINYGSIDNVLKNIHNSRIIASKNYYIIDGHHRYAFLFLANENIKTKILKIDLPTDTLMKLALSVGDALGNKRNK